MAWVLTSNNFDVWLAYDLSGVSIDEFTDGVTDSNWDKFLASTSWNTLDDFTQFIDENAISAEHSASEPATTYPSKIWVDTDAQGQSFYQADKGFCNRPLFEYKDADEVTVYSGAYYLAGSLTPGRFCFWNTSFNITVTATTGWNYLYLLDAACSSLVDGEPCTDSCFSFSTTAPTWDDNRRGWYDSGYNRCIFATFCGTASTQDVFWHEGGDMLHYDVDVADSGGAFANTNWVDVTLTLPGFSTKAKLGITTSSTSGAGAFNIYWRMNGSSSAGHVIGPVYHDASYLIRPSVEITVLTDSSHKIEFKIQGTPTYSYLYVKTRAWYFPRGM